MKTKKNIFSRIIAATIAALSISIICSFCAVSAMAAEVENEAVIVATAVAETESDIIVDDSGSIVFTQLGNNSSSTPQIVQLGNNGGGAGAAAGGGNMNSNSSSTSADSTYKEVVEFFIKWIRRVGVLVAFIGGVMFALAIKNNDAEQKQAGLLTLVAGFVVAALCTAADMFDLFT